MSKETTAEKEVKKFDERINWYINRATTRKTAIHAFCFQCASSTKDSKECPSKDCPLFPFRLCCDSTKELKAESAKIVRVRKSKATKMNRGKKAKDES